MKNVIVALAVLSIFMLSHGCNSVKEDKTLSDKIYETIQSEGILDLKKATSFEWDTVYVLHPYSNLSRMQSINCDLSDLEGTGIEQTDHACLLVFKKGNSIIKYCMHPRSKGDFAYVETLSFSRSDAVFKVNKEDGIYQFVHKRKTPVDTEVI